MTVIGTNISAMKAANASTSASLSLSSAMERLSTGKRINKASDDAAGLAISNSMTSQIRGMNQAIRNANDGIALAQTADGALDEASNILQRMRELAVQSASDTYGSDDRQNMQTEVDELSKQLDSLTKTKFNGVSLFNANQAQTVNIQAGYQKTDTIALSISQLDLSSVTGTVGTGAATKALGTALSATDRRIGDTHTITAEDVAFGATFKGSTSTEAAATKNDIGNVVTLKEGDRMYEETSPSGTVTNNIQVTDQSQAGTAMDTIDAAMTALNTTRASIGAGESRLQSAVNSLTTNSTNLADAKSRIEDTDFSAESTNLAKAQILSQASTAMLAQANQSQQNVLSLLK